MSHYDNYPIRERWDGERFARERSGRSAVTERDHFEERDRYVSGGRGGGAYRQEVAEDDYYSRRGPQGATHEDDRFYEREERYGPPARRAPVREERKYYEEDEYDDSPRRFGGRHAAPPRPGMLIRRQSSLDTFDRRPAPRYHEPETVTVPPPRGGRYGQERHRYEPRYSERDYYDDIRVAEPDWYGDDDFRGWKEREVETIRKRRPISPAFEEVKEKEELIIEEEKPWPRKGKTRMSARLVNKRALVQLGYPYEDEFTNDGDFVIILKALNKELIDEVLALSKEISERMSVVIEGPGVKEEIVERREIVVPEPAEVPRSVREWDVMSGTLGGKEKSVRDDRLSVHETVKSKHSRRSKSAHGHASERSRRSKSISEHISAHGSEHKSSRHTRRSSSSSSDSTAKESALFIERKHSKSRRGSRSTVAREKVKEVIEEDFGESNSMHPGPLALVAPRHERSSSKDERRIKEEIRELEAEKRHLKRERRRNHHDSSDDEVIIERVRSGSRERRGSTIKVEKDRKDSRAMKAMLATLT